jgi:multidrug efflux system outer membrane protein
MASRSDIRTAVLFLALTGLSACSMTPAVTEPAPSDALPASFDAPDPSGVTRIAELAEPWWAAWESPELDTLIDSVVVANLDLEMAAARVLEVQEAYRMSRSGQLPALQASAGGTRQNTPTNLGATGRFASSIPGFPERFDVTTYSASLGLAWELDLWGRGRATARAGLGQVLASEADYRSVRMGIIAETVAAWVEWGELIEQTRIADAQLVLLEERLALTQDRYRRGLVSSFEWNSVQQQRDEARAARPLLEARRVDVVGRLAVLLGGTAQKAEAFLPSDGAPRPGVLHLRDRVPSEWVRERPDVMAAAARREVARQTIGIRRAEQFPSFSLTASGGTQSAQLAELVNTSQRFWLFGGSLTAPVFASGARRAAVRQAWAAYDGAEAAYEKAVLGAFQDVSVSLATVEAEQQRLAAIRSSHEAARASYLTARDRYVRGVGPYLAFVDAQLNVLRTELALSQVRQSHLMARLRLQRAVGGPWERPAVPVPAAR